MMTKSTITVMMTSELTGFTIVTWLFPESCITDVDVVSGVVVVDFTVVLFVVTTGVPGVVVVVVGGVVVVMVGAAVVVVVVGVAVVVEAQVTDEIVLGLTQ